MNQCQLLASQPAFDLLFCRYRVNNMIESLKVQKAIYAQLAGASTNGFGFVLMHTALEIIGYADIKPAALIAENVDVGFSHIDSINRPYECP